MKKLLTLLMLTLITAVGAWAETFYLKNGSNYVGIDGNLSLVDEGSKAICYFSTPSEGVFQARVGSATGDDQFLHIGSSKWSRGSASNLTLFKVSGNSATKVTAIEANAEYVVVGTYSSTTYAMKAENNSSTGGDRRLEWEAVSISNNAISDVSDVVKWTAVPVTFYEDLSASDTPLLTIGCVSDVHCMNNMITPSSGNLEDITVRSSLTTVLNRMKTEDNPDVLVFGGDSESDKTIAEENSNKVRQVLAEAMRSVFQEGKNPNVLWLTGNHDYEVANFPSGRTETDKPYNAGNFYEFPMKQDIGQLPESDLFYEEADNGEYGTERILAAYHYVLNGFDFVVLNCGKYFFRNAWDYTFSTESATWVQNKLQEIDPAGTKTIFFLCHVPFPDSNSLNSGKGMNTTQGYPILKAACAAHPNLVMLYGHDHGQNTAYIREKTSQRVTLYDPSGNVITTTDANHVDGTTQGEAPEGGESSEEMDLSNIYLKSKSGQYFGVDSSNNIVMQDTPYTFTCGELDGVDNAYNLKLASSSRWINSGTNGLLSTTNTNNDDNVRHFYFYEVTSNDGSTITAKQVEAPSANKDYLLGVSNIKSGSNGFFVVYAQAGNSSSVRLDVVRINSSSVVTLSNGKRSVSDIPTNITLTASNTDSYGNPVVFNKVLWQVGKVMTTGTFYVTHDGQHLIKDSNNLNLGSTATEHALEAGSATGTFKLKTSSTQYLHIGSGGRWSDGTATNLLLFDTNGKRVYNVVSGDAYYIVALNSSYYAMKGAVYSPGNSSQRMDTQSVTLNSDQTEMTTTPGADFQWTFTDVNAASSNPDSTTPQEASFFSSFMGSLRYYYNAFDPADPADMPTVVQALVVKVYNDRVELHMKNYAQTGDNLNGTGINIAETPTPYTSFRTVTHSDPVEYEKSMEGEEEADSRHETYFKLRHAANTDGQWYICSNQTKNGITKSTTALTDGSDVWQFLATETPGQYYIYNPFSKKYIAAAREGHTVSLVLGKGKAGRFSMIEGSAGGATGLYFRDNSRIDNNDNGLHSTNNEVFCTWWSYDCNNSLFNIEEVSDEDIAAATEAKLSALPIIGSNHPNYTYDPIAWTNYSNTLKSAISAPCYRDQDNFTIEGTENVPVKFVSAWVSGSGGKRYDVFGVELIQNDKVVYADYHYQVAGGSSSSTSEFNSVAPGTYKVRVWVSKRGTDNQAIDSKLRVTPTVNNVAKENFGEWESTSWTDGVLADMTDGLKSVYVLNPGTNRPSYKYYEKRICLSQAVENMRTTFQYMTGSNRLDIKGVEILSAAGGDLVSCDFHDGNTGNTESNNAYSLSIPKANTEYIFRVWVSGTTDCIFRIHHEAQEGTTTTPEALPLESGVYEIKNYSGEGWKNRGGRGYLIDGTNYTAGPSIADCEWSSYEGSHYKTKNDAANFCKLWYVYKNDDGDYNVFSLSDLNSNTAPRFLKVPASGVAPWSTTVATLKFVKHSTKKAPNYDGLLAEALMMKDVATTATTGSIYFNNRCGTASTSGAYNVSHDGDGGVVFAFIPKDVTLTEGQTSIMNKGLDMIDPVHAAQNKVNAIWSKNGKVGYPKDMTSIEQYQGSQVTKSNVAAATAAADALMANTDINFPVNGKAYTLISKCPTAGGYTLRYMKYTVGTGLSLVTDENEATKFLAIEIDAESHKYGLVTPEGTFVVLKGNGSTIGFNSNKGYAEMYNEDYAPLTFARMTTNGSNTPGSNADMFGLVAFGGRRNDNTAQSSYFVIGSGGGFNQDGSFFMRYNTSYSNAFMIEDADGVTAETAGYADGVEKYNLYTTAKTNNTTYASYFGEGLGKYHYGDNQTTGYMDAVKACTTLEQERAIVPVSINMPESGKFYRLKATNDRYMCSDPENGGSNDPEIYSLKAKEENEKTTIFHLTADGHLIAYATGTSVSWGWKTTLIGADHDCTWTISEAENAVGKYAIQCPTTTTWAGLVYIGYNNNTHVTREGSQNGYTAWEIEEVDELPVSIGATKFATFYTPVELQVPAGVTAYVCNLNGENLAMYTCKQKDSDEHILIPAGTAVMLNAPEQAEATAYNFTIPATTQAEVYSNNSFFGDVATKTFESMGSDTYYSLQRDNANADKVGFFVKPSGNFKGFQAFLSTPASQTPVQRFNVTFDEDAVITGFANVLGTENISIPAFDLSGRKVDASSHRGLYIMNGKKVIR